MVPPVGQVVEVPVPTSKSVSVNNDTWNVREMSWVLHGQLSRTLWEAFEPLLSRMEQSKTWQEYFTANEPAQYEIAFVRGLSAVCRLSLSDHPDYCRRALRKVEARRASFERLIETPSKALKQRLDEIRQLGLPDTMLAGYLTGSPKAGTRSSFGGWGALGGATIGSVLLPGIGTVVGAIIGGFMSGQSFGRNTEEVVLNFDTARTEMFTAVREGYQQLWDRFAREVRELGEVPPLTSSEIAAAEAEFERVVRGGPVESVATYRRLSAFIDEHGPKDEAVYLACRFCLDQRSEHRRDAQRWKDLLKRLYPDRIETIECDARYSLEQKEYDGALSVLGNVDPNGMHTEGVRICRVEVMGAQGRDSQARRNFPRSRQDEIRVKYWLALVRGLFRHGNEVKVWDACDAWIREADNPGVVGRELRLDPLLSPHYEFFADHISRLRPYREGKRGLLRAIVEAGTKATKTKVSYTRKVPTEVRTNANESFLILQPTETLLYFYDWSTWGNGKSGLALTDRRLIWKCVWQEPVQLELRDLDPDQMTATGTILQIHDKYLDTGDILLTHSLPTVLREVRKVVGP